MENKIKLDSTVKFFITIIGLTVVGIVLKELDYIFMPFIIAYLLYFLFNPLNTLLENKKFPKFIIVLIDLLIIILIIWGISSFIINSFIQFSSQLPTYEDKLNKIVTDAALSLGVNSPFFKEFSIQKMIAQIDYRILAGGIFTSTFSFLGSFLFVLFFFIFVVTGHGMIYEAIKRRYVNKKVKPGLKELRKKYNKNKEAADSDFDQWIDDKMNIERDEKEKKLSSTFKAINEQIQRYIVVKIAINLSAGIIVWILLALFGVDFPIVWGMFTFLFNFIPTIGSAFALALPTLMVLIQFGSISFALLIALVLAGVQTLFFSLIETTIMGKRLNLNPLLILLSVLVWGYIWGVVGMLLSVPLTAIIKIIISNSES
ncbi:MAG TPA: AI-2E family transporter, partial [Ignavibacteria bacterium]|nr:AI-2E family transporter [Ignavibacteria bacterium]